jgi:hypothetical protein
MVYHTQNYWVFGLFPSSGILGPRKHDVSETGSVSVLRCGGKMPTQLGPLERIEVSSVWHLNWSWQESGQGLDEQNSQKKYWESTTGLRQAKGLIAGPSARRTKDLLKLNKRPVKMGGRTIYRTLSPKRAPFQTGVD